MLKCRSRTNKSRQASRKPHREIVAPTPHGAEARGISAGQLEYFFKTYCGDVVLENGCDAKPICLPTKLAELCVKVNMQEPSRTFPYYTSLYAVNDFFIKPHTIDRNISYSELLNPRGLLIDYFISHHWGEDFAEFVQSVLRHARCVANDSLVIKPWNDIVYWCCAFANNQHDVDLGQSLEESPFHKALSSKACKGTVLNLNRMGSALFRVWCIYEAYLTHRLGKTFLVNTCQGPITSSLACSSSSGERDIWIILLFRLMQVIDIEKAVATKDEDKVKIMRAIRAFDGQGVAQGTCGAEALNTTLKAALANQALPVLARKGETELVKQALMLRVDPDYQDCRGICPLTYASAIFGGRHPTVKALIEGDANPEAADSAAVVLDMFGSNAVCRSKAIHAVEASEIIEHMNAVEVAKREHQITALERLVQELAENNAHRRTIKTLRDFVERSAPAVFEICKALTRDADSAVRELALDALNHLSNLNLIPKINSLAEALEIGDARHVPQRVALAAHVLSFLGARAAPAVPELCKALAKHSKESVRERASIALGIISKHSVQSPVLAEEALKRYLEPKRRLRRSRSGRVLDMVDGNSIAKPAAVVLDNHDGGCSEESMEAVIHFFTDGETSPLPMLTGSLVSGDGTSSLNEADVIRLLSEHAIPVVTALAEAFVGDGDGDIHRNAAEALGLVRRRFPQKALNDRPSRTERRRNWRQRQFAKLVKKNRKVQRV